MFSVICCYERTYSHGMKVIKSERVYLTDKLKSVSS